MKLYCIISTNEGLDVWHYETLDEAVKAWLEGLKEGRIATSLKELYESNGAQAVIDMTKEMDFEDAEYLWDEGEQRIEEVDIPWAISHNNHEAKVDRLECDLQDAIEEKATKEQRALLDSIEAGYEGHANRLTDCLSVALSAAADRCGYSSPEYKAIDEILTYINNPA
jgi:hypothetical protein